MKRFTRALRITMFVSGLALPSCQSSTSGPTADGGTRLDAGARVDAGPGADAGPRADAGPHVDASSAGTGDAGDGSHPSDAGGTNDAGSTVDAAREADASTMPDPSAKIVDNSGTPACSDAAGHGTLAQPWCTIGYAIGHITSGDTIYVRHGTYDEDVYMSGPAGTATDSTTLEAYPGDHVILHGSGVDSGRNKIVSTSYVRFGGFEITNYNQGLFVESAHDIFVHDCEIHHVGQEGLHVHYDSAFVTVDSCTIHDTRQWMYNGEGMYIGTGDSAPVDNTNHVTLRHNTIYNTPDEGIELKIGTHHCTVDGNTIYHVNLGSDWSHNGIDVGAIEANQSTGSVQHYDMAAGHVIENNFVHDVGTAIRAGTNATVVNNVIWSVSGYGVLVNNLSSDTYARSVYHNTIAASATNAVMSSVAIADIRNNLGPTTATNMASMSSYFVSVAAGSPDYHLVAGSAPINAGASVGGVTTDRDGNPRDAHPDIGAYEYGAGGGG